MAERGAGIVGLYLDREKAREEWCADQATIDKGMEVKRLLREIRRDQPLAWSIFLGHVTLDQLLKEEV
jgi:hypothetical protein